MKHIFSLAVLAGLLIGCTAQKAASTEPNNQGVAVPAIETPPTPPAITQEPVRVQQPTDPTAGTVRQAAESQRAAELRRHMEVFAADSTLGRKAGQPGFDKAADYLIAELKKLGIAPYYDDYKAPLEGFDTPVYNVVAKIPGSNPDLKDEWVILGAHLDHIGLREAIDGDSIANGANDNAAGSTVILELARQISRTRMAKGRSIMIAWFTAEESGLVGSNYLSRQLKAEGFRPYVMLNFEMLGVPMKDKDHLVYMTGFSKSNMAEVCNRLAGSRLVGYFPKAEEYQLFLRSDNLGFYKEFGMPAHTFSSFDFTNYDFYHHVEDESGLLNYEFMAEVVQKFVPVVVGLVNGEREVALSEE